MLGSAPNIPRTEPKRVMPCTQPVSWGGLRDAGAKWLSEEALQIAVKEAKQKAKEKRKDIPI